MKELYLKSTPHTPLINFNHVNGKMVISGRAIPEDVDAFWMPVLDWFESYVSNPHEETFFSIHLEYFNIASSKRILFLLYKLNELKDQGKNVRVEWLHRKEDEEMYEVGQDYAYMVKVPFVFKEIKDEGLLTA